MQLILMRHAQTQGNLNRVYLGLTDEPLCEAGCECAASKGVCPQINKVYVSPMERAKQTAAICFPNAEQVVVDELHEIDFGKFENKTHEQLDGDPDYQAWLDNNCAGPIPEGESRYHYIVRSATALSKLLVQARDNNEERVIVVAHGGTCMAAMHALCPTQKQYFEWHVKNGCGWRCKVEFVDDENAEYPVRLVKPYKFEDLSFIDCKPRYPFFSNTECPYFPCHNDVPEEHFNCAFCYCPLYALGEDCGGNPQFTKDGIKDCNQCSIPHQGCRGIDIVAKNWDKLKELARKKTETE